ncbi:tribbles homolog 2-like [Tubulanus polymorphus]|uniref:tribbles homolog 2-like n=1 Tax=Tubulanus polymorphus TaxID=672921 RepID=UPI003DA4AC42
MNIPRPRPRPLVIPSPQQNGPHHRKQVETDQQSANFGNLSPDLQPNSPPAFPVEDPARTVLKIGRYLLQKQYDGTNSYTAVNIETQLEYVCKVISVERYRDVLSAYWRIDYHDNINDIVEIIVGETNAYVVFERSYGDLHSYVRDRRRLKEDEVSRLFGQIAAAVACCHDNGIVLRDLKLRKFVFKDKEKTQLKLESLEDVCVLEDENNDCLVEKHGCPAYVSPEILHMNKNYSGKSADIWSLGVMLYTMLVGRYPFHDNEPSILFSKIRRGHYTIPDTLSSRAKCLIRSLLRREPTERLTGDQIAVHPWFTSRIVTRGGGATGGASSRGERLDSDQTVPDVETNESDCFMFT